MADQTLKQLAQSPRLFRESLTVPTGMGPRRFGDVMADFQRERFAALDPALLALAAGRKPPIGRYWWEATKGASKDSDLAVALLWLLTFCRRPLTCQVGAADQDQADELRKAAKAIVRFNPWLEQFVDVQARAIVNHHTDSRADIIAADAAGSHGARPDVVILNELSHVTNREFAETLLDNAAKVPGGLVVIATNAGFVGSWQWDWRESFRASDRWLCHIYDRPAPWIDRRELDERARTTSNSRFRRLWWGEWSQGGGDALDRGLIAAAVNPALGTMLGDEPGWVFVAGLDLGVTRDHAALVTIAKHVGHVEQRELERPRRKLPKSVEVMADLGLLDSPGHRPATDDQDVEYISHSGTGRLRLAAVQSWRPPGNGGQIDLTAVESAVLQSHKRFRSTIFYDPFQAALMAQRLVKAGVPMIETTFKGSNLDAMASEFLEQFNSRNVDLYNEPELLADLEKMSVIEKSYGHRLDASRSGEEGHADRATGLAIAILGAKRFDQASGPTVIEGQLVCYP